MLNKLHGGEIPETAIDASMEKINPILRNKELDAAGKLDAIKASLDHPAITDKIKSTVIEKAKEVIGEGQLPRSDIEAAANKI